MKFKERVKEEEKKWRELEKIYAEKYLDNVKELARLKGAVEFKYGVAINADFFEIVDELKKVIWNLVIFDPPYIKTHHSDYVTRDIYSFNKDEYYSKFIPMASKAIAPLVNDSLILFCGTTAVIPFTIALCKEGLSMRQICMWLYKNMMPKDVIDTPAVACEPFVWFGPQGKKATFKEYRTRDMKYRLDEKGLWGTNVFLAATGEKGQAKSRPLYERIVKAFGYPPVLDPMAGWMTTAVVCEKLGFPWVCVEIRKEIFEEGIRRIK